MQTCYGHLSGHFIVCMCVVLGSGLYVKPVFEIYRCLCIYFKELNLATHNSFVSQSHVRIQVVLQVGAQGVIFCVSSFTKLRSVQSINVQTKQNCSRLVQVYFCPLEDELFCWLKVISVP
jgi:hypothetical protein